MTHLLPCGLSNSKALLEEEEGKRERVLETQGDREREKEREKRKQCFLSEIKQFLFSHSWPLVERTEPNHCLNDAKI